MSKKVRIILISVISVILISLLLGYIFILSPILKMKKNPIEIVDKVDELVVDTNSDKVLSDKEIDGIETANVNIYKEEKKLDEVVNILLVGLDARSYDTVSRSDSMILVSYNTKEHKAKLISVMRDTWAYIPDYGWSRINAATVYGGVGLLINTLNRDFDLDIQNYVQIKFDDFKKIIDILGGVDVELTQSEIKYINMKLHTDDSDYDNDVIAEPGLVHLNGAQTLWHCRNRTIGNSDFSRTERQRHVLGLLVDKFINMDAKTALELLYDVQNYINTNIPLSTMKDLIEDALINRNIEIESYRIPFDNTFNFATKNGASVLSVDLQKNAEMLHDILGYTDDIILNLPPQPKTKEDLETIKEDNEQEENVENVENVEDVENEGNESSIENIENLDEFEEISTTEDEIEQNSDSVEDGDDLGTGIEETDEETETVEIIEEEFIDDDFS